MRECTIVLKIPAEVSSVSIPPRSLFMVGNDTRLELLDCNLKAEYAVGHPHYVAASENRSSQVLSDDLGIQIAHFIEGEEGKDQGEKSEGKPSQPGTVSLVACSFTNFFTHLMAGRNSSVRMERCGFFRCKGSAVIAENPINMRIEESIFEDCNEAGIEVRWKRTGKPGLKRTVTLERNSIGETAGSGIALLGEKNETQIFKADVVLNGNRVQSCKQDGICIRNVSLNMIELALNSASGTAANGIGIYSSHCSIFNLENGVCKENSYCGIYIQETACNIKSYECSCNGVSGIGIIGCPAVLKPGDENCREVTLADCSISSNRQSGISLLDFYFGVLNIVSCRLSENKDYGIFLSCHESPSTAPSQSISATGGQIVPLPAQSRVVLMQGEMKRNKKGGIYLSQQYTHIDGTAIKENGEFAVYIPTKDGEKDLAFSAATLMKKCINGHIGGRWGRVSVYSANTMCGCTICSIF